MTTTTVKTDERKTNELRTYDSSVLENASPLRFAGVFPLTNQWNRINRYSVRVHQLNRPSFDFMTEISLKDYNVAVFVADQTGCEYLNATVSIYGKIAWSGYKAKDNAPSR